MLEIDPARRMDASRMVGNQKPPDLKYIGQRCSDGKA
jgi:hypothetical protein